MVRSGRLGTDAYPVPAHCYSFEARRMRRGRIATLPEFSTGLESEACPSRVAGGFTARFSLARHMRGEISPEIRLIRA